MVLMHLIKYLESLAQAGGGFRECCSCSVRNLKGDCNKYTDFVIRRLPFGESITTFTSTLLGPPFISALTTQQNSPMGLLVAPQDYLPQCAFTTVEWLITLGKAINNQSVASVEMIAFCTLPQRWGPLLTWVLSWQCYFLEGNCRFGSLRGPDWE